MFPRVQDYDKRKNTYRAFKKKMLEKDPKWVPKHVKDKQLAALNARVRGNSFNSCFALSLTFCALHLQKGAGEHKHTADCKHEHKGDHKEEVKEEAKKERETEKSVGHLFNAPTMLARADVVVVCCCHPSRHTGPRARQGGRPVSGGTRRPVSQCAAQHQLLPSDPRMLICSRGKVMFVGPIPELDADKTGRQPTFNHASG